MKKKIFIIITFIIVLLTSILLIFIIGKEKTDKGKILMPEIPKIELTKEEETIDITLNNNIQIPIGSNVPSIYDLTGQNIDAEINIYLKDELITTDILNEPGTYNIEVIIDNNIYQTTILVKDITPPTLTLKQKAIYYGQSYKMNDFINECNDDSKSECILSFKDKAMSNYKNIGTYEIIIIAKDSSGNISEQKTNLTIKKKKTTQNNTTNNNSNNNNENNNTSDENNTQNGNTQEPEPPKEEPVTIVNTTTETLTSTTTKYGVKITEITKVTYNIYSDGTKKEISRKKNNPTYDYTGYNATTNDLKEEATSLTTENKNINNEILNYLNLYRTEVNVDNLKLDNTLTIAANIRALELAYSQKFDHERPNGSKFHTAITEIGGTWNYVGENIAGGYTSAKSVSEGWKNSPGHYSNMINSNFKKVGIGHVYVDKTHYWVQLFSN